MHFAAAAATAAGSPRAAAIRSFSSTQLQTRATLQWPSGKVSTTRPTLESVPHGSQTSGASCACGCAHCGGRNGCWRAVSNRMFTPTSRFSSCAPNPGSIAIEFVRSMIPCASSSRTLRPNSSSSTPDVSDDGDDARDDDAAPSSSST